MLIELKGVNGQLELYKDKIIIKKKGAPSNSQAFSNDNKTKTIYLSQISNVRVKTGSMLTNGYIQFSLTGENESTKGTDKIINASRNENTIIFMKRENELALKIKTEIEQLKQAQSSTNSLQSSADEIRKFKQLFDDGIITEEEFNKKKKELLN